MRFGDVITAVAAFFLVTLLTSYPLEIVLISALGLQSGPPIGASIAVSIGAVLIGYVFSGRMTDSRSESIVKISVLFTVRCYSRSL